MIALTPCQLPVAAMTREAAASSARGRRDAVDAVKPWQLAADALWPSTSTRTRRTPETLDLDACVSGLLALRGAKPPPQPLPELTLRALCRAASDVLLGQPSLLELEAPLSVCGDIHGQYNDLLRHFDYGGFPPESNYLFLGDYVDRGQQSIETMALILALKVKYPENFFLLRGNHETASVSRHYGFYDECNRRYNIKVWRRFCDTFNCLPVCAVVSEKIMCMHGGISPELHSLQDVRRIARPTDVPDEGVLCDLLWSDPSEDVSEWGPNDRGVSVTFGQDALDSFLSRFDLDLVCRGHQVVEDGYEFFGGRRLITLFSAPNYTGDFDNAGASLIISEQLICSFKVLKGDRRRKSSTS